MQFVKSDMRETCILKDFISRYWGKCDIERDMPCLWFRTNSGNN